MRKIQAIGTLVVGIMLVTAAMTQAALVGHWEFDETGVDTYAIDATGNGYDGLVANPVWTNGVIGGALLLNGTDCSVNASYWLNPLETISNTFTIAFWCYGDASQKVQQNAFSGYVGGSRQLNCHFPWDGPTVYYDANAAGLGRDRVQFGVSDATLLYGKWNHWVFTKDAVAGTMAVYVNGASTPIASGSGLVNHMAGITAFTIGSLNGSDLFYKGMLDDFRLYDHVLSTNEIAELYNAVTFDYAVALATATPDAGGPPLEVVFDGSGSTSSTNIVSYSWNFGDGNSATGMISTNIYAAVGDYTAILLIEDANGITASNTVDVSVFHFVNAVASATPAEGEPPLEVVFDGSGSTSSTNIVSYSWDFGDGNVSTDMIATNIYVATGVYTSSLVVVDANSLMDTNTVVVSVQNVLNVDLVVSAEYASVSNAPSFLSNDLAQVQYFGSSFTGGNEGAQHAELFNGIIGNTDDDTNDSGEVRLTSGETITIEFDVTVNTDGYDLTEISSIAGWDPGGGGRANQGYGVLVTRVDDTVAVLTESQHWAPNNPSEYWTKVTMVETNGLAMAQNVKAVTFFDFYNANPGGVVIYREIDILGVPSGSIVPTPDAPILIYDGVATLSWATTYPHSYDVQKSGNLTGGWTTFTNVTGTPPTTTVTLPAQDQGAEFYQVIAQ